MMTRWWNWIRKPAISEVDDAFKVRFLTIILGILVTATSAMIVLFVILQVAYGGVDQFALSVVVTLIALLISLGLLLLARRGRIRFASTMLLGLIWTATTVSAYQFEGIADGSLVLYFLGLGIAGLLLGRRAIVSITLFNIAGAILLFSHDLARGVPKPDYYIFRLATLSIVLAIAAYVLSITIQKLNDAIVRGRSEIQERQRAEQAEVRQRQRAESLLSTATLLTGTLDLDTLLDQILAELSRAIPYEAASLIFVNDGTPVDMRVLGYAAPVHSVQELVGSFALMQYQAAGDGQPVVIRDGLQLPGWNRDRWGRSCAGVPVLIDGQLASFLTVKADVTDAFNDEHIRSLTAFANLAAIAIKNATSYQTLELTSSQLANAVARRTQELMDVNRRVEGIFDSVGEGLLVADKAGYIERINTALTVQTGYQPGDLVGKHFRELLHLIEMSEEDLANMLNAVQASDLWQGELVVVRADGIRYDAAVTVAPLRTDDPDEQEVSSVISLRDISQMKEIERMKTRFLVTAAHELRTPLTSIRGFSEVLLNRQLPPEQQREYLTIINDQSVLLSTILNDLLDVTRLESGEGMPMRPSAVDAEQALMKVLKGVQDSFPEHTFQVSGLKGVPSLWVDEMRLGQVFLNLLSNAAKYSPGGGMVEVVGETHDGRLRISVTDHGIGMTEAQQARLFEAFYRADEVVKMSIGGTGLGLAISKYILDLMEGSISVKSRYGVGSTFTIELPLAQQASTD